MKVKTLNLIYGFLALGFPFALGANDGSEATARSDVSTNAETTTIATAEVESFDPSRLEDIFGVSEAMQEALRERLRAWTDEVEAVHREKIAGVPVLSGVLARN